MSEQFGTIIDVSTANVGDDLVADAALSATTIFVADATAFDEIGGRLSIADNAYAYIAVDLDLHSITLTTGLLAAALIGDRVELFPPAPVKLALIDFGIAESEAVQAVVPHNLVAVLADGMREEADREVVLLEERSPGELYVKDLAAKPAEVTAYPTELGDAVDLDIYTEPGVFAQVHSGEAAAGANYPVPYAGVLEVISDPLALLIVQRYSAYRNDYLANTASMWGRVWGNGGWSPWSPLVDDTGWISVTASIAVASTGWSITSANLRRVNRTVHIYVFASRTGAPITVATNGDITSSPMFQMVAAWRPNTGSTQGGLGSASSGRMGNSVITVDGTVSLTAVSASGNISTGDDISVAGEYLVE